MGGLSSGRRVRRALPFRPAGERRARRAARRHVRADVARQFETLCLHRDLARRGTRRADVSSLPDVAGARPMAEPPQAPRHSRAAVHARLPRGQAARLRGAGARRRGRGLCVGRSDRCDRAARGADRAPQRRLLLSAVRRSAAARDRQPVVSSFAPALGRRVRNTPSARTGRRGRRRHRRMARRARRTARRRIGDRRRGGRHVRTECIRVARHRRHRDRDCVEHRRSPSVRSAEALARRANRSRAAQVARQGLRERLAARREGDARIAGRARGAVARRCVLAPRIRAHRPAWLGIAESAGRTRRAHRRRSDRQRAGGRVGRAAPATPDAYVRVRLAGARRPISRSQGSFPRFARLAVRSSLFALRSSLATIHYPLSTIRFLLSALHPSTSIAPAADLSAPRSSQRGRCAPVAFAPSRPSSGQTSPAARNTRAARTHTASRTPKTHRLSRSRPDRRADTVATLDRTWPAMLDLNTRASRLQRQAAPPHAQPRGTQPAPCTPRGLRDFFVERGTLYTESSRRFLECPSCSRRNRRGPGRIAARKIRI
ncbi:hypothetical protein BURPS1710b_1547 [Burkholderia pseudomallei 1710b]|uniref:Uncharacterized protein n=3 Tax=Burkholderia pseudomallei TaxID=28450 RepID=Q3JU02_BURP1|nr:hypothetical protein BURPS1710b_1547 [Burkholderia pseudomallei 1710b]